MDISSVLTDATNVIVALGLKERLVQIPNAMSEPAPEVDILEFDPMGPVLSVRPYCNNEHYWQVWSTLTPIR